LISKARESLVSLGRLLLFFNETPRPKSHMKTVLNDLTSLSDHASFLSTKVNFLLDATLGLINIEQNGIIKIVSVAAVVFLPPTLVASVYGMNFDVMPELKWVLGYPFAVVLMISSAVLPYVFFKRKGWL
jgi:magnesium transporter